MKRFLTLTLALSTVTGSSAVADRSSEYVRSALRGDLVPAKALLLDVAPESLSVPEQKLARTFRARFVDRNEEAALPDLPPFARDVVVAYRSCWTAALMGDVDSTGAETLLRQKLAEAWAARGDAAPADSELVDRTGDSIRGSVRTTAAEHSRPVFQIAREVGAGVLTTDA